MRDQFSAIIVDDEPLAIEGLRRICAASGQVSIVGEARDGSQALELVERLAPQAVFLDIAMPGMTGLTVAASLCRMAAPPKVVLVSANDHFATEAFDLAVVDYVLKPLDRERVMRAIDRVSVLVPRKVEPIQDTSALWAPYRGTVVRVAVCDIRRLEAERDYVRIHDANRSYLMRATLSDLADRMPKRFVRIHRSTAIARDYVRGVRHAGGGSWVAVDTDGRELPIGRAYLADARIALEIDRV